MKEPARLTAALCTLIGLAAAAQASHLLWQEIRHPAAPLPAAARIAPEGAAPLAEPQPPRRWPPLFGEPQPPKPPAPAPAEPQAAAQPQPPKPPLASLGYTLSGVVQSGGASWAMVAHPAGSRLLRAGDDLAADIRVVRIGADGLWLSRSGGPPELLAFPE